MCTKREWGGEEGAESVWMTGNENGDVSSFFSGATPSEA